MTRYMQFLNKKARGEENGSRIYNEQKYGRFDL